MIITPKVETLAEMQKGARMSGIMPELEEELDKLRKEVESKVFAAIQSGTFTKEMAEQSWLEVYAFIRLLRRFRTHVTVGRASGEKAAPAMKLGDE